MHTLTLEGLQAKGKAHQVYKERQERGSPMGELNLLRELCFQSLRLKKQFPLSLSVYKGSNFYLFSFSF